MVLLPGKIQRTFFIFIFFISILFPAAVTCAEDQMEVKKIVVIETSGIYHNNSANARHDAISQCLISSVDIATASLMSTEVLVKNFQLINETLKDKSSNYINNYRVLAEYSTDNSYKVMVEVTVFTGGLEELLSGAGIAVGEKRLPKILFLIAEKNVEDIIPKYWWGEDLDFTRYVSESAMAQIMGAKGFTIIDHIKKLQNGQGYAIYDKSDLSDEDAIVLANQYGAEVVVVGTSAVTIASNVMGLDIKSFQATVTVRAIKTDTGQKIGSTIQSAVKAGSDATTGGKEALFAAGSKAGEDIAAQVKADWEKEKKELNRIEVNIKGTANLSDFVKFRQIMESTSGVQEIRLLEMGADEATVTVDFAGDTKTFADALMVKTVGSIGMNIYEISQDHLKIALIHDDQDQQKK